MNKKPGNSLVPNVTISAQRLSFHIQRYRAMGGQMPPEDYLDTLGISREKLETSEQRFPVLMISLAADNAAIQLGDPVFGLSHAEEIDRSEQLFLHEICQNAETLAEFIDLLSRYTCIYTEISTFEVRHEKNGTSAVQFRSPVKDQISYHQLDGCFALLCNAIRYYCGIAPLHVALAHPCPADCCHHYELTFRCPVVFDSPDSALYLNTEDLLKSRQSSLTQQFFLTCEKKREKLYGENLAEKASFLIRRALVHGEPKREQIAEALCVSLRTFQRNLARNSTTYQKLLENTRKKMAQEYLCKSNFSATQTALLLGYTESSQFYKAFRRWFQVSPTQFKADYDRTMEGI